MDYMKGYNSRRKRRRASRNHVNRPRKNLGEPSYYNNKSKYSGLGRRQIPWRTVAVGTAFFAVIALLFLVFVLTNSSSGGESEEERAVSGSGVHDIAASDTPEPSDTNVTPGATMDPEGIAAEIAVVPTLPPEAISTPQPKPRSKAVALTFDDGPSTENTPKVLEILKQYNAHATFFIVGNRAAAGAEILKQEIAQGCEIGNHSWDHTNLAKLSMKKVNKQYDKTADLVKKLVGYDIKLLRPPYGAISQKMRDKLKHPMVLWNVDTLDWKTKKPKAILKQVKKTVKDGDIILMHDIHPTTAEALKTVLPWLIENDYDILTVSELAARKGAPLHNGKAYGGFTGN